MARGDKYTPLTKKQTLYRDFLINFDKSPLTDQLAVVENEEAVKQRCKNLLTINPGEVPYSTRGAKITALLFEPMSPLIEDEIRSEVVLTLRHYEPGIDQVDVTVQNMADQGYLVRVVFTLLNIPGQFAFDHLLTRLR